MELDREGVLQEVRSLVDRYRQRCLWFLREDYYPATFGEVEQVLQDIEAHGDREAYQEARRVRTWLSRLSSGTSAS